MHDVNRAPVLAVENSTRRFDDLTVAGSLEFLRSTAAVWMRGQLANMIENALDQFRRRDWILNRDVIGNRIQV